MTDVGHKQKIVRSDDIAIMVRLVSYPAPIDFFVKCFQAFKSILDSYVR